MEWIALVIIFLLSMGMFYILGKRMDMLGETAVKIVEELELSVTAIWDARDKDLARIHSLEERIRKIQQEREG
jgi:hypothetical protein